MNQIGGRDIAHVVPVPSAGIPRVMPRVPYTVRINPGARVALRSTDSSDQMYSLNHSLSLSLNPDKREGRNLGSVGGMKQVCLECLPACLASFWCSPNETSLDDLIQNWNLKGI